MSNSFEPQVSETAKARVAKEFGHLPAAAATTVAAWLTLLEGMDARYERPVTMGPEESFATATAIAARSRPFDAREYDRLRRDWRAEREPIERELARLLAYYPRPIVMSAPDAARLGLQLSQD